MKISAASIRRIVRTVLNSEHIHDGTVSVALVDNATIHRLNREYLKHDYATDVLSFVFESSRPRSRATRLNGEVSNPSDFGSLDGELIVSAEMALNSAGSYGCTASAELALYVVHGLLHLCGYDDCSSADRRTMRARERELLGALGFIARRRRTRGMT